MVQEITIKGAAERIFAALLDPAELMEWWRATGKFEVTHVETDLRVGGKWLMRVKGNCGPTGYSTVTGVYQEVVTFHTVRTFTRTRHRRINGVDGALGSEKRKRRDQGSREHRADKRSVAHAQQRLANRGWIAAGLRRTK